MRILIDILHPAHLHRLKHFIWKAQAAGDVLLITARDKEVVGTLLKHYGLPYVDTGDIRAGTFGRFAEYGKRTWKVLQLARDFHPDVLVSGDGFTIGPVGRILGVPSVSVSDTEDQGYISKVAYCVVSDIITPHTFRLDFGKKHIRFHGFYEMTYVNDAHFTPNPAVLRELGVQPDEPYSVIRLVSWQSVHDAHEKGLTLERRRRVFYELAKHGKVFISAEGQPPEEFAQYAICPKDMHSVLYYAQFYFGDSQTMSIEAGLLGTPAIRCNSLVDQLHAKGQFDAFHNDYGIVYSYSDFEKAFQKMQELLSHSDLKGEWKEKRERLMRETEDFTDFFFSYLHDNFYLARAVSSS